MSVPYPRVAPIGAYAYRHQAALTAGVAVGAAGARVLHAVTVNAAGSGVTLTLYDGSSTSGAVIAAITPVAGATYRFDVQAPNGLFLVVAGTTSGDYTISFL